MLKLFWKILPYSAYAKREIDALGIGGSHLFITKKIGGAVDLLNFRIEQVLGHKRQIKVLSEFLDTLRLSVPNSVA